MSSKSSDRKGPKKKENIETEEEKEGKNILLTSEEQIFQYLSQNPSLLESWIKQRPREKDKLRRLISHGTLENSCSTRHHDYRQQLSSNSEGQTWGFRRPSPLPSGDEDDSYSRSEEIAQNSVVPRTARKSVTRDLFQQWLSSPKSDSAGRITSSR